MASTLLTPLLAAAILILYCARHSLLYRLRKLLNFANGTSIKSPSVKSSSTDPLKSSSGSETVNSLPPSRRHVIQAQRNSETSQSLSAKQQDTNVPGLNDTRHTNPVPLESCVDNLGGDEMTPTGFSLNEIRELGDFPDYAALSGVPNPSAYSGFDIEKALPRPYRPIRWQYFQTMSLSTMEPDWWIELENTYIFRMKQRQEIYNQDPKAALQYLPGSELACKELMELALEFLCARYPQYFFLDKEGSVFRNNILGTTSDLKATHPLHVLLKNVPEDYAIMMRNPEDGLYYLRAAVICTAQGWTVDTKIGLPLNMVHEPVPHYKEKMQLSMNRYFSKLPTDKPIQRGAWSLEIDQPVYVAPGSDLEDKYNHQDENLTLERCHLRVDWQTLRRLPLTGVVVFNFKVFYTPVTSFREEPFVPALLLKNMEEGEGRLMEYKRTWHVEHVIKPALAEWKQEQVERGLVPRDWEVKTLDETPYFPGWHEKWTAAQGF